MGNGKWACLALEALIKAKHTMVGVVCETDTFDEKESEFYKQLEREGLYLSLKNFAKKRGLAVFQPEDFNSAEFKSVIDSLAPDLLISCSYHQIIRENILNAYTTINAHGAPLPKYRGRAPIAWSIINGEKKGAVTVHFVDKGIDTGGIIVQHFFSIGKNDYAVDVLKKILRVFPRSVCRAVAAIEKGNVKIKKQNKYEGWYFPKRAAEDGATNFSQTAEDVYNWIRAQTYPYPGAFAFINDRKIFFNKCRLPSVKKRVSPVVGMVFGVAEGGGIKITTTDSYIIIDEIRENGAVTKAAEKIRLGSKFSAQPLK